MVIKEYLRVLLRSVLFSCALGLLRDSYVLRLIDVIVRGDADLCQAFQSDQKYLHRDWPVRCWGQEVLGH